jgi:hypothetical protein
LPDSAAQPPAGHEVDPRGERADQREQVDEQRTGMRGSRFGDEEIGGGDDERADHRDGDADPLPPTGRLAQPEHREQRDDHRLGVHEDHGRRDAGEGDRGVPAPEVEREHGARPDGDGELAAREATQLPPFARDDQRDGDHDERERETPRGDRERMRRRQPDERTGEGDAQQRETEDDRRPAVRPRLVHAAYVSASRRR